MPDTVPATVNVILPSPAPLCKAGVLNQGRFCSQETLGMVWPETFTVVTKCQGISGCYWHPWAEVREGDMRYTVRGEAPTANNYLAPNVSRVEAEKLCCEG